MGRTKESKTRERVECDVCSKEILLSNLKRHNESKSHKKKLEIQKLKSFQYSLGHLYYECIRCKVKITVPELIGHLYDNEEDIQEITEEHKYSAWEVSSPTAGMLSGRGGDTINYSFTEKLCNCSLNHEIELYIIFTFYVDDPMSVSKVYYIDSIEDIIPLNSKTLILSSDTILLKGYSILTILHWLFESWAAMGYRIEIISPFIDEQACLDKLLEISIDFKDRVHHQYPISVYTRYYQGFNRINLIKLLKTWIRKKEGEASCGRSDFDEGECFSDPNYPCIHNIQKQIVDNFHYTKNRFHAKYYAGYKSKKVNEIVFTSFNLIKSELSQIETFCLHKDIFPFSISKEMKWEGIDYRTEFLITCFKCTALCENVFQNRNGLCCVCNNSDEEKVCKDCKVRLSDSIAAQSVE